MGRLRPCRQGPGPAFPAHQERRRPNRERQPLLSRLDPPKGRILQVAHVRGLSGISPDDTQHAIDLLHELGAYHGHLVQDEHAGVTEAEARLLLEHYVKLVTVRWDAAAQKVVKGGPVDVGRRDARARADGDALDELGAVDALELREGRKGASGRRAKELGGTLPKWPGALGARSIRGAFAKPSEETTHVIDDLAQDKALARAGAPREEDVAAGAHLLQHAALLGAELGGITPAEAGGFLRRALGATLESLWKRIIMQIQSPRLARLLADGDRQG